MPTWTIKIADIVINTDQLEADPNFIYNQDFVGPRRQQRVERQFIEQVMRDYPEFMVTWAITQQPGFRFRIRSGGAPLRSGTDGEFVPANDRFRAPSANFTAADIGRIIRVPRPTTPPFAAGHYFITDVPNQNAADILGIKPGIADALPWEIWEAGDFVVALTSLSPT